MLSFLQQSADTVSSWFSAPKTAPRETLGPTAAAPRKHRAKKGADRAAAAELFSGYADGGGAKREGNGGPEERLQELLGGEDGAAFRKDLTSSSMTLNVFQDKAQRGSCAQVEIDFNAVLGEAGRSRLTFFEALKRHIEANYVGAAEDWEQSYRLAEQVTAALARAQGNPELLEKLQDSERGLKVTGQQTQRDHREAAAGPSPKDVLGTMATEKLDETSDQTEIALREGWMAAASAGKPAAFTQALLTGLAAASDDKRSEALEFMLCQRAREARGGSKEMFDLYDQLAHQLARKTSVRGDFPLDYKGKLDFSGTPIVVAQEDRSHAELVGRKDKTSAETDAKMEHEKIENLDDLKKVNLGGPVIQDGVSYGDVKQGGLGDCYFIASLAATAQMKPELIQKSIQKEDAYPDGTKPPPGEQLYSVTFHNMGADGISRPIKTYVTNSVMAREEGGFLGMFADERAAFAHASSSDDLDKAESWPMLYEKAFAKLAGSYNAIGNGGSGKDALEAITGMKGKDQFTKGMSEEQIVALIESSVAAKNPVVANTISARGKKQQGDKREHDIGDGIVSDHEYTVLGVTQGPDGPRVKVRNPWGMDGHEKGNGEQELSLEQFKKYFPEITTISGPAPGEKVDPHQFAAPSA